MFGLRPETLLPLQCSVSKPNELLDVAAQTKTMHADYFWLVHFSGDVFQALNVVRETESVWLSHHR